MADTVWKVVGYDSTTQIFSRTISSGLLSVPEMKTLLQRLASTHLSADEILQASLRKNAKCYAAHLEITVSHSRGLPMLLTQGTDVHYVATIASSN
ncbi:MAG: hypothetical protein ABL898_09590 [Hyphomicrobiaceae bacterium]|nr:hypothetical protein [Hyphomicrobiaceae bacterium]